MAPQPYPAATNPLPNDPISLQPPEFSPTSLSSPFSGSITNIVFGLCALLIGVITIWQAHKAWSIWRVHHPPGSYVLRETTPAQVDVELGHPYTPPPIEDHPQEDRSYIAATGIENNDAAAASLPTDDREPASLSSFSTTAPSSRFPGTSVSQSITNSTSEGHDHATTSIPMSPLGRRPAVDGTMPGAEGSDSSAQTST